MTNSEIEASAIAIIQGKMHLPNLELTTDEVITLRRYFQIRKNTNKAPCRTQLIEFCYEIANEIKSKKLYIEKI